MSKFTLEQLTEDIRSRHMGAEGNRLTEKWNRTGLLRGLDGVHRENMSMLLENQAAQLLRETNSLSTGGGALSTSNDIRGFTNIAFPIVRRVFGGLVANELVSIQPMSLPSGLLFYLDYTYGTTVGGDYGPNGSKMGGRSSTDSTYAAGQSIYNNPRGKGVRSGSLAAGGMYDLGGIGYSRVHSGSSLPIMNAFGAWGGSAGTTWTASHTVAALTDFSGSNAKYLGFDPQVRRSVDDADLDVAFCMIQTGQLSGSDLSMLNQISITDFGTAGGVSAWGEKFQAGNGVLNLRRATRRGDWASSKWTDDPMGGTHVLFALGLTNGGAVPSGITDISWVKGPSLSANADQGDTITIPAFESDFGTGTPSPLIPEIDIKIESIAVTAATRKLRARWSPELAQDLNAYHSMDAEVELTQILSEQIALELDREILNDLLTEANGANLYWSRAPGKFLDKESGAEVDLSSTLSAGPAFTGTVREWYETLTETIIDVANTIHRKTLRGSANFIVVGPDVATILESSVLYKPNYTLDGSGQVASPMSLGAEKVGSLSNRFTVYKDPYFPRNKILVGYKGGSYLETGYVYAPYVPLIVTPTIFAPEDFTPRKGVMTRYGKKMVRSDFYGTVTVVDLHII
jgi:hypothetical protein